MKKNSQNIIILLLFLAHFFMTHILFLKSALSDDKLTNNISLPELEESFSKSNSKLKNQYPTSKTVRLYTNSKTYFILVIVLSLTIIVVLIKYYIVKKKIKPIEDHEKELAELKNQIICIRSDYKSKKEIYDRLKNEVDLLEEDLELKSIGLYQPYYDFDTPEMYKRALEINNKNQKDLVKNNKAVICRTDWKVEGSKGKGTKLVKKQIKLMLKSFNSECDAIIAKTRWNNIKNMEARINKSYEQINKTGEIINARIESGYLDLKLRQLDLTHEYKEKLECDKQEKRRIREEMRDELKAKKEIENEQKEAAQEEKYYQKALEKIRGEYGICSIEEKSNYEKNILELEEKLKQAEERMKRSISQAQLTKAGHVYIISNIGSFGKDIYKIGMTRRLDPIDRVIELGDASVPFKFDVHAMIYSDDAPSLEQYLHNKFQSKQVNLVNSRKEFFNVTLDEIKTVVTEYVGEIDFNTTIEAKEYRESVEIIKAKNNEPRFTENKSDIFPDKI